MKKVISILILMILMFLAFEWGFTFFKKGHEVNYEVYFNDKKFQVDEVYEKTSTDIYDILITNDNHKYSYVIGNQYNKQKKIIKEILYYQENGIECIYPILENKTGTYIECIQDNQLYTELTLPNQSIITNMKSFLTEKNIKIEPFNIDLETKEAVGTSSVYTKNLKEKDTITLWNYKGIEIIRSKNASVKPILNFDKYENTQGYLVGNYYIVPNYLSSKVQEFDSVTLINLENSKTDTISLGYTLSSDTYINGIVDNKLYYTDPSNLLQIEINLVKKIARLIGSNEIGGQLYNGKWQNANIYDFRENHILFEEEIVEEVKNKFDYQQIIMSNNNYYILTKQGEVYRVSNHHLDSPILLYKQNGIHNLKVVANTIYFIIDDTLYYQDEGSNIIPVLKNNELRYNTVNRVDIYQK